MFYQTKHVFFKWDIQTYRGFLINFYDKKSSLSNYPILITWNFETDDIESKLDHSVSFECKVHQKNSFKLYYSIACFT